MSADTPIQIGQGRKKKGPGGKSSRGSHQLAAVSNCARSWRLRYRKHLVPEFEPKHRMIGTAIHTCAAYHYNKRMATPYEWPLPLDEALKNDCRRGGIPEHEIQADSNVGVDFEVIEQAHAVMREYIDIYSDEPWDPLYIEEEFAMRVGDLDPDGRDGVLDDELVTVRPDLVIRSRINGQVYIVDHKTTSKSGWRDKNRLPVWNQRENEYRVPWQPMLYLHVMRHNLGQGAVAGFVINRIRRERGPQTGKFDFSRHLLDIPESMYREVPGAVRERVGWEAELDRMIAEGKMPRPNPSACHGVFGPCDYVDLCTAPSQRHVAALIGLPVEPLPGESLPPRRYVSRK